MECKRRNRPANHFKLENQIEQIIDKLCLERDQACKKRYQNRLKNKSMKKDLKIQGKVTKAERSHR